MTVTIETSGIRELEQLLRLLKEMNIKKIKIQATDEDYSPTIVKGNKKVDPSQLFGIWKNHPKTIEQIRETAWRRRSIS